MKQSLKETPFFGFFKTFFSFSFDNSYRLRFLRLKSVEHQIQKKNWAEVDGILDFQQTIVIKIIISWFDKPHKFNIERALLHTAAYRL